jgi:hypothetical protein
MADTPDLEAQARQIYVRLDNKCVVEWGDCDGAIAVIVKGLRAAYDAGLKASGADKLKHIGGLMANVCFNLAQNSTLPEHTRKTCDELRRAWDAAISALRSSAGVKP